MTNGDIGMIVFTFAAVAAFGSFSRYYWIRTRLDKDEHKWKIYEYEDRHAERSPVEAVKKVDEEEWKKANQHLTQEEIEAYRKEIFPLKGVYPL